MFGKEIVWRGIFSELISVDKCNGRGNLGENDEFCARLPVEARRGLGVEDCMENYVIEAKAVTPAMRLIV
jgi:hypothetical protein